MPARKSFDALRLSSFLVLLMVAATYAAAQTWKPLGPDGGDVRSLAYDPNDPDRIFLGTSSGTLYTSIDGGANWLRLAQDRKSVV